MSKYLCELNSFIYKAYLDMEFTLDPSNFLNCEDEDDLRDAIEEYIYDRVDYGDISVDESDGDITIPKEFIEEWKSLKGLK